MKITILGDKYRVGSKRGITKLTQAGYLGDLNKVVDFEGSVYPKKLKEGGDPKKKEDYIEDREFLGSPASLKPGNMFLHEGQVFAIESENDLVLCVTETGAFAIKRFLEEILGSEVKLSNDPGGIEDFKVIHEDKVPEEYETYKPGYYLMKSWKEKTSWEGETLRFDFTSSAHIFPVTLYLESPGVIRYDSLYVDPEEIYDTTLEALRKTWRDGLG
jgi:hypothetical protein